MKQDRMVGIVLAGMNVVLIMVCLVLFLRQDRTEPVFEFHSADIIYRENMDTEGLLKGISAYDSVDGDITDRIVIEKITENPEENSVVVYYAVSDRAGNVAKSSRVFGAVFVKENSAEKTDLRGEEFLKAGINAELNPKKHWDNGNDGSNGGGVEEEAGGEEETQAVIPAQDSDSLPTAAPTKVPVRPTEAPSPGTMLELETEEDTEQGLEEGRAQETEENHSTEQGSVAPVLTLKVSEVKVRAGRGPAWVDIISNLSDDRDDYGTLFGNLKVSDYDRNTPGTYQVSVYTEDSDGNHSAAVPLTIIVQQGE